MAVPLFNLAPDMAVSRLCLGTMTFGEQNSMPQSFQLLDKALDSGINFFDSAEMYPVPQRAETHGRSEEYLGRWIRSRNIQRRRLVIATKVCGPSGQMTWIRNGPESLDARNITAAIDLSLLRLQTDYIDLYQVHWPDRYVPMFGETEFDPSRTFSSVSFEEQLTALDKAIVAGKIRYIGLSNETPYGLMKFLRIAEGFSCNSRIVSVQVLYGSTLFENSEAFPLPLIFSPSPTPPHAYYEHDLELSLCFQNAYNLLCRNFDSGMAECCHHERVSLLAYSPLAMGILTGKYLSHDGGPTDARLNLYKGRYAEGESRYNLSNGVIRKATELYLTISKKYGVHPVSLAIAFVLRHPCVASAVFGATKVWQLEEVLNGCTVELNREMVAEMNEIHSAFPSPCP